MILWNCLINEGNPFSLSSDKNPELLGKKLRITSAIVVQNSSHEKSYINITKGVNSYVIGMLQKDKADFIRLNLCFRPEENIQLNVSGKSTIQILGYFENDLKISKISKEINSESEESSENQSEEEIIIDAGNRHKKPIIKKIVTFEELQLQSQSKSN